MTDLIRAVPLAVVLFVATNLDDIFLLVGFFAGGKASPREVVAGQFVGLAALTAVSLVAAAAALVIPREYVGLLGLAPIALGVKAFFDRDDSDDDDDEQAALRARRSGWGRILGMAAVTIANGGDNIGVYVPVFATRTPGAIAVIVVVFAVMTAIWCAVGHWLVHHPLIGAPIRRWGPRLIPFVLIALGVLILWEAGTVPRLLGLARPG